MPATDLSLSIGYWIVSHKATLKRWWAVSLMIVIFLSLFWVATSVSVYLSQGARVDGRIEHSFRALGQYQASRIGMPRNLDVGQAMVVPRGEGTVDLSARVTNANTDWGARQVKYHFSLDGKDLPSATIVVNSGEARDVVSLNHPGSVGMDAGFHIESVAWVRVTQASRIQDMFETRSVTWEPTMIRQGGRTIDAFTLKAAVVNSSVYNFYTVDVTVVLLSGDQVVGVDEQVIDRWSSLAERNVTAIWPSRISGVTSARVTASTDLFDESNRY